MSKRRIKRRALDSLRRESRPWPWWAQVLLVLVFLGLCALAYYNATLG